MARRANLSDDEGGENKQGHDVRTSRQAQRRVDLDSKSPTPSVSFSSDKENRSAPSARRVKSKGMGPPQTPASDRATPMTNRKRKFGERANAPNATQVAHRQKLEDVGNTQYYDPEQDMDERRKVRKNYRDLSRELTDSRAEYLAPGSDGLIQTLNRSNKLYASVRQTSDATLDSRLLVSTAELSMKRTTQLNLGDNTIGIEIDDVVSKCITFMRRGPAIGDGSAQTQRRGRLQGDSDEEGDIGEGYDEGDAFNWEWLGRQASCPHNVRPPLPGFLLGPLSVQRRARKATQRRERLQKRDPKDAVRPEELKAKDLEQVENSNLTTICKNIRELLVEKCQEGEELVERDLTEDMTKEEIRALMKKHGIADSGGVPLFHFVVDPQSFGQTVENLFYVSFLIRDGAAGIGNDSDMIPTLHPNQPSTPEQIKKEYIQKHQAIFHLDFETWEDIIETFDIKQSVIPHRQPDSRAQVSASGWEQRDLLHWHLKNRALALGSHVRHGYPIIHFIPVLTSNHGIAGESNFNPAKGDLALKLLRDGPRKLEKTPRRVRGLFDGAYIFDNTDAHHVWEHPYYPQFWVPKVALKVPLEHTENVEDGSVYLATLKGKTTSTERIITFAKGPLAN
ncbi:MAG: hypothetical protein Q9217_001593 [Psora testacea]